MEEFMERDVPEEPGVTDPRLILARVQDTKPRRLDGGRTVLRPSLPFDALRAVTLPDGVHLPCHGHGRERKPDGRRQNLPAAGTGCPPFLCGPAVPVL